MRLTACLSFYDEHPAWLAATAASLAKIGCDHLVAFDGAYMLLPEGKGRSATAQQQALIEVTHGLDMGITLHAPKRPWQGNEVEKRAAMFAAAVPISDWIIIVDADEVITSAPADFKKQLADTDLDVAECVLYQHHEPESTPAPDIMPLETCTPLRILFRALPDLTVTGNHYTYVAGDKVLWGNGGNLEPALNMHDLRVEHRTHLRAKARKDRQEAYYARRRELGVEMGQCARCEQPATRLFMVGLERQGDQIAAGSEPLCEQHVMQQREINQRDARRLGFNPDWQYARVT